MSLVHIAGNVSGNLSVQKLDQIVTMFRTAALVLGVVVRDKLAVQVDIIFRLLFMPGFDMTEEFSKFIKKSKSSRYIQSIANKITFFVNKMFIFYMRCI